MANKYEAALPDVVYGGTYDFIAGTLTVTFKSLTIDETSAIAWVASNGCAQVQSTGFAPTDDITQFYSDRFKAHPNSGLVNMNNEFAVNGVGTLYIKAPALFTSLEEARTYFTENPTQFVGLMSAPLEYTLTPQEVTSLLGENNVWSNGGDISELIYMFTDEIIINNEGMPAIPTINASEAGPTVTLRGASHVLAAGDNRFSDFILQSGENVMQVEDPAGTLTIKYQEGML